MIQSGIFQSIAVCPHHIKQNICGSRAKYREGRRDTAVKVYTVNQESFYLLVSNVPAVGAGEQLQALCDQFGTVVDFKPLDDYPSEEFTEVYLVKYDTLPSSRVAKKQLDDKSFFGGCLHVCYAPEFESVSETRLKLQERRKYVAWKTNSGKKANNSQHQSRHTSHIGQSQGSSCHITTTRPSASPQQPVTYVWAGKEYTLETPPLPSTPSSAAKPKAPGLFVPRQCKSGTVGSFNSVPHTNPYPSTSSQASVIKENASYHNTMSQVRKKIASVSVPNVRVSLKRKKRL